MLKIMILGLALIPFISKSSSGETHLNRRVELSSKDCRSNCIAFLQKQRDQIDLEMMKIQGN